jgi:hypothetical protein
MDPIVRGGRVTQMFFNQGAVLDESHQSAAVAAAGESSRRPGQTMMFMQAADFEQKLIRKSRAPLYLAIGAGAVAVVAAALALVGPLLLGPPGSDRQAVQDHARAFDLLRREDPQSLQAADKILSDTLARKPAYLDAQGDRGLVLQFIAQQKHTQVARLQASIDALNKQVQLLTERNEPRDAALAAQKKIWTEYEPLAKEEKGLEQQAANLVTKAAKEDPRNAAGIRARAFIAADQDNPELLARLQKAYLKEVGKAKDGWSELMAAELATAGKPSEEKRTEGKRHADDALALDPGLVRARYLKALLDAQAKDEAALKEDITALVAANTQDTVGAALLAGLQEVLAREKAEKEDRAARLAAATAKAAQEKPAPAAKPKARPAHPKHR